MTQVYAKEKKQYEYKNENKYSIRYAGRYSTGK